MRKMPGQQNPNMTPAEMREALHECHEICQETVQYCLEQGGKHAEASHIRMMLDCAEMCQTAENFMTRSSPMSAIISNSCADICEACAVDCEKFGDDNQMRACAEACRTCADACRQGMRKAA